MYFLVLILCLPLTLIANIGPQGFYSHWNHYFVETGTLGGEAIQKALNANFQEIHSCDIDVANIRHASERFKHNPKVHLYLKDSGRELWDMIKSINGQITFWLDAHNGFPDPNSKEKNTPLIQELEQIKWHPIKTHTIMIDDLHCCGTLLFDYLTKEDIINKVLEINPNYHITFEPGGDDGEYPQNVLVARP